MDEILATSDQIVQRMRTPSLELSVRLEAARGLFQRRLPSEVLAALDGVWESAQGTEQAWYLRSGSMLMLGLSLESEQLAEAAIERRPTSVALRWIQSLARLAAGDVAGSRAALEVALLQHPGDELLLLQQAILSARQKLGGLGPAGESQSGLAGAPLDAGVVAGILDALERRPNSPPDSLGALLWRFGARAALLPADEAAREARAILRAMSSNGSLSGSVSASMLHSARSLILEIAIQLEGKSENPDRGMGAQVRALLSTLRGPVMSPTPANTLPLLAQQLGPSASGPTAGNEYDIPGAARTVPGNIGALLKAIGEGGSEGQSLAAMFSSPGFGESPDVATRQALPEDCSSALSPRQRQATDVTAPIYDPSVQLRLGLRFLDVMELTRGHVSAVRRDPVATPSGRGFSGRILAAGTGLLSALALATGHSIVSVCLAALAGWMYVHLSPKSTRA